MSASLLDGKLLASQCRNELKHKIQMQQQQGLEAPGLAVILIGNDPASTIYVANKRKACVEIGIKSYSYDLPVETTEKELLNLIEELNQRSNINGILVQLPLPAHINQNLVIEHISPQKDVDGFHPYNLGRLAQKNPLLRPCTPLGIMHLLAYYQLEVKRKNAVVIGASNIVGRPLSLELLLAGATVTTCHKFTSPESLKKFVQAADFIFIATGVQNLIDCEWLNHKQVLVDVGMHRLEDGSLRGDVDFTQAVKKVAWITPVPGGVGPMTIATLLENTAQAQLLQQAHLRDAQLFTKQNGPGPESEPEPGF